MHYLYNIMAQVTSWTVVEGTENGEQFAEFDAELDSFTEVQQEELTEKARTLLCKSGLGVQCTGTILKALALAYAREYCDDECPREASLVIDVLMNAAQAIARLEAETV